MEWIVANKEWLFSGVGIALISSLIWLFRSKKEESANPPNNSQLVSGVTAGGEVLINQTISKDDDVEKQIHITFMSLKQMPGRLQEAINSGATEFSFNEARKEIETLYAIADRKKNNGLKNTLIEFQDRFNNYIKLINQVIKKKVTLDKVNQYHNKEVVDWFAENILNKKT
jgi:hypothetical protein